MLIERRAILAPLAALPLLARPASAQRLVALTPTCTTAEPTLAQSEGPFVRPDAPLKRDLAADVTRGERMQIGGLVLDASCRPLPGVLVQVWQADDAGRYDGQGFRLRGHQFTDVRGGWLFDTIVPAPYWPRTRHFHVKLQRPHGPLLTTHLYFPNDPQNGRDREFDQRLVLGPMDGAGRLGRFDFTIG